MLFKNKLKYLMEKYSLTQQELAEKVGVGTHVSVSQWLAGAIPRPSKKKALANYFKISPEILFDDTRPLPAIEKSFSAFELEEARESLRKSSFMSTQELAEGGIPTEEDFHEYIDCVLRTTEGKASQLKRSYETLRKFVKPITDDPDSLFARHLELIRLIASLAEQAHPDDDDAARALYRKINAIVFPEEASSESDKKPEKSTRQRKEKTA